MPVNAKSQPSQTSCRQTGHGIRVADKLQLLIAEARAALQQAEPHLSRAA